MNREQVLLAMGHPRNKSRETQDGDEVEDWVYGNPPGKVTFVTFSEGKVVKVREDYANIGGSTAPALRISGLSRGKRKDIEAGDGQFRPRAKSGLGTEKSR